MPLFIVIAWILGITSISAAEDTELVNKIDEITRMKVSHTFVSQFSAVNITLEEALKILDRESKNSAKQLGHQPISFMTHPSKSKMKVTIVVKNNSMWTICSALAEQTNTNLVIGNSKVLFDVGEADAIK